jgi:hypothetical protein
LGREIPDSISSFIECNFIGHVGVSVILLNYSGRVGGDIGDNSLVNADIFRSKGDVLGDVFGGVGTDVLGSVRSDVTGGVFSQILLSDGTC